MRAYKIENVKLSVVYKEIIRKTGLSAEEIAKRAGASFGVANQLLHDKPTSEKFISNLITNLDIKDEKLIRRLVMAYLYAKFQRVDETVLKKAGFVK